MLTERLKALWNGEIPLVKTYWLYGFIISGAMHFFTYWVMLPMALSGLPAGVSLFYLSIFLTCAYLFILLVGTWRSADFYQGPKIWKNAAKLVVVIGFLNLARVVRALLGFEY